MPVFNSVFTGYYWEQFSCVVYGVPQTIKYNCVYVRKGKKGGNGTLQRYILHIRPQTNGDEFLISHNYSQLNLFQLYEFVNAYQHLETSTLNSFSYRYIFWSIYFYVLLRIIKKKQLRVNR